MKFSILKRARVLPCDVARILGVSRVTASMWINGHSQPHKYLETRVILLLDAVKTAVQVGDLPLSKDLPRERRYGVFKEVVYAHLPKGVNLSADTI